MKTFVFSFTVKPSKGSTLYTTVKHGYAILFAQGEGLEEAEEKAKRYLIEGVDGNEKWEILSSREAGHESPSEHLLLDETNKALYRKAQRFGVAVLISGIGFDDPHKKHSSN